MTSAGAPTIHKCRPPTDVIRGCSVKRPKIICPKTGIHLIQLVAFEMHAALYVVFVFNSRNCRFFAFIFQTMQQAALTRWFVNGLIGIYVAVIAVVVALLIHHLSALKFKAVYARILYQ